MRTPQAKYATYSNWPDDRDRRRSPKGEEVELYDYSTHSRAPGAAQQRRRTARWRKALRAEYERAFTDELREPLPPRLVGAHARGFADYFSTARHAAVRPPPDANAAPNTKLGGPPPGGRPTARRSGVRA